MYYKNCKDLLYESTRFDYCTVLAQFDDKFNKYVESLRSYINLSDMNKHSHNDPVPHLTIVYGYKEKDFVTIFDMTDNFGKFSIKTTGLSVFKNTEEDYDVLVLSVEKSDKLMKLFNMLDKIPHFKSYKYYNPHITIAYVHSGVGNHYKDILDEKFKPMTLDIDSLLFSYKSGTKTRFEL